MPRRLRRGDPSRARSAVASGARTIAPSTTPQNVAAALETPRGGEQRAGDVAGRHGERRRKDEQVAAERRVAVPPPTRRDQHDLAGERDRAADEPARPGRRRATRLA